MQDVWRRIETVLERIQPGLSRILYPPADDAALARTETALGVALPADYRASALIHDGMALYLIDSYRLLSLAEMLERRGIDEMLVDNGTLILGDSARLRTQGSVRAHSWNRLWVTFADNGGGDSLALDLDPPSAGISGQVITQSRDREALRVVAPSFRSYLVAFANDVEQDRYDAVIEDDALVSFLRRQ